MDVGAKVEVWPDECDIRRVGRKCLNQCRGVALHWFRSDHQETLSITQDCSRNLKRKVSGAAESDRRCQVWPRARHRVLLRTWCICDRTCVASSRNDLPASFNATPRDKRRNSGSLHRLDLNVQRRLADSKPFRRPCHVQLFRKRHEVPQVYVVRSTPIKLPVQSIGHEARIAANIA